MSRKRKKKVGVPLILVIFIVIIIIVIGIIMIVKNRDKENKSGYIENGNVVYSNSIINKSYNKESNKKTIEIKTENSELNSLIITNEIIEKIKNNSSEYNRTLKEVLEDNQTSNRDIYNIKKAIELKYVEEDTKLVDYYWKITGFKSLNKLIEFCEDAFQLVETNV